MEIDRGTFIASLGATTAAGGLVKAGAGAATPMQGGSTAKLDFRALHERTNRDGEFLLKARYWNARLRLDVGDQPFEVRVVSGKITDFAPGRSEEHTSELQSRGHLVCR